MGGNIRMANLKLIVKANNRSDLTKEALDLKKKELPSGSPTQAIMTMLEDAKKDKRNIYKITKSIPLKNEIPKFIFL